MQNSTLRTNETGRNLPLKCRGVWLSPVIYFWYIPLQFPAIVCQHTSLFCTLFLLRHPSWIGTYVFSTRWKHRVEKLRPTFQLISCSRMCRTSYCHLVIRVMTWCFIKRKVVAILICLMLKVAFHIFLSNRRKTELLSVMKIRFCSIHLAHLCIHVEIFLSPELIKRFFLLILRT